MNSELQRKTEGLLIQYKISHSNGTDCNDRFAQYHHHHVLQMTFTNSRLDGVGCSAKDYCKAEGSKREEHSLLISVKLLGFLRSPITESSVSAVTVLQMG